MTHTFGFSLMISSAKLQQTLYINGFHKHLTSEQTFTYKQFILYLHLIRIRCFGFTYKITILRSIHRRISNKQSSNSKKNFLPYLFDNDFQELLIYSLTLICQWTYNIQLHNLMQKNKIQIKSLREIAFNRPDAVTGSRNLINCAALYLFPTRPQTAGLLLMISVILDYFDGAVARKYNECSFFGDAIDWITDISTYFIVLLWWYQHQPEYSILFFGLFFLESFTMITDMISKSLGYPPKLKSDEWCTFMLKYTMDLNKRGYNCVGVGYWNMIFHFLCMTSRILFIRTHDEVWLYLFIVCIPMSISYVWMHVGYTATLLESWNEQFEGKEIHVKFID